MGREIRWPNRPADSYPATGFFMLIYEFCELSDDADAYIDRLIFFSLASGALNSSE
jgi:hypothetical protein